MILMIKARTASEGNWERNGIKLTTKTKNWLGWIPGNIPAITPNIIPIKEKIIIYSIGIDFEFY